MATLDEVREKKSYLEQKIRDMLRDFESVHKVSITGIEVEKKDTDTRIGVKTFVITQVKVRIEI